MSDPGILQLVEAAIRENRSMKRISITALCASVMQSLPSMIVSVCTHQAVQCVRCYQFHPMLDPIIDTKDPRR